MAEPFRLLSLCAPESLFEPLQASACFEPLGTGRSAAVLTQCDTQGRTPLVRTTTRYQVPAQPFLPLHRALASEIARLTAAPVLWNNALLEHYTGAYRKMGFHSDQALDLAEPSHIAIFSCYRDPLSPSRKLVVEPKQGTLGRATELMLPHHGVVLISTATNRAWRHKIVPHGLHDANEWIGLTLRTSNTWLRFSAGRPYLESGESLELACASQQVAMLAMRRQENLQTAFCYPALTHTLSESDLVEPQLQISAAARAMLAQVRVGEFP